MGNGLERGPGQRVAIVILNLSYRPDWRSSVAGPSVVFERELAGRLLDFGTTARLRHLDLVMYDRQTES